MGLKHRMKSRRRPGVAMVNTAWRTAAHCPARRGFGQDRKANAVTRDCFVELDGKIANPPVPYRHHTPADMCSLRKAVQRKGNRTTKAQGCLFPV
jgi:hypothetical protein